MTDDRYEAGMRVRREVLGDAHVDRAEAEKADLTADLQTMTVTLLDGTGR